MKRDKIFEVLKVIKIKQNIWSISEDKLLLEIHQKTKKNVWIISSKLIKTKSPLECKKRFRKINTLLKKGRWTQEEDEKLTILTSKFGKNWILFSKIFKNRSTEQIRIRYSEYLVRKLSKIRFSSTEDLMLKRIYYEGNPNWKLIKQTFPERSFFQLKRRLKILIPDFQIKNKLKLFS